MDRGNAPGSPEPPLIEPITDPAILAGYLTDASNVHGHAEALVRPRDTAQVAEVVRHCQREGIPLTITAGRTSTTAAPVPFGGWLLSTERLDGIHAVRPDHAEAGAGVRLGDLQRRVADAGRLFPPDPTSRHDCTIGAAIACNASGPRSFRYGPTRPWVDAVEVVWPDGSVGTVTRDDPVPGDWPVPRWTEPAVKTAAGFAPTDNLLDLVIGQEGTLAVITRATLRLTDPTGPLLGVLAFLPDRASAVALVRALRSSAHRRPGGPLSPIAIEYLDRHCLALARARVGDVPEGARAALFCEQPVHSQVGSEAHLDAWWSALTQVGALADATLVTDTEASTRRLHALRHAIPAGINEQVVRNGMPKVGTDLAVPDDHLGEIMDLYEACPLPHATFGHIGDNHLHCNVLPRTPSELATARAWYDDVARAAVAMGGTISAEHGVGKLKRALLAHMVGPETLEGFRALKRHLDPAWILGRGTLLDPGGNVRR